MELEKQDESEIVSTKKPRFPEFEDEVKWCVSNIKKLFSNITDQKHQTHNTIVAETGKNNDEILPELPADK